MEMLKTKIKIINILPKKTNGNNKEEIKLSTNNQKMITKIALINFFCKVLFTMLSIVA